MSLCGASAALAHDATHGDDLATGREVPAPPSAVAPGGRAATTLTRAAVAAGPRSVAVIMLNFTSLPTTPWTADQVRATVFTDPGSVNAFEQEQSYGGLSLTGAVRPDGDVFGWYTIDASTSSCDPDLWMTQANAKAVADGVALGAYQHHIYLFPKVAACAWAGLADMPGQDSFINGTTSVRVIAHELGHNIGAQHASTMSCVDGTGARVAISGSCTLSEYGDPFDVMGSSDRQSAAFRKVSYGFMSASATATVVQTGTYQVVASSVAPAGIGSLRVVRPGSADAWYLELRGQTGVFDDFVPTDPAVTGVTLRLAGGYGIVKTRLVDAHPATTTFADAPLQPGEAFTDSLSGTQIAVQSVSQGVATIAVTIPGTTPLAPSSSTPATTPSTISPPVSTPPAPTSRLIIRRVGTSRASVRVVLPATGASRCAVRVGPPVWSRCRIAAGRVSLARVVAARGRTLIVAVRIDGRVVQALRVAIPRRGATVRMIRALRAR